MPGLRDVSESFTRLLAQPNALLPESASIARVEPAGDFVTMAPIPRAGDVFLVNAPGGSPPSWPTAFFQWDRDSGRVERLLGMHGCGQFHELVALNTGGSNHVWGLTDLSTGLKDRYLLDINLTNGTVWAGVCNGCNQLRQAGDQRLWVIGSPESGRRGYQLLSINTETRVADDAVTLNLPDGFLGTLVPARGWLGFHDGEAVVRVDPASGDVLARAPADANRMARLCSQSFYGSAATGVFADGGHVWVRRDDQLTAHDPQNLVPQFSVAIPQRSEVFNGPSGIWYLGVKGGPTTIELGHIDASSGSITRQRTFETTLSMCVDEPDVAVTPALIVDTGGVWYLDSVPPSSSSPAPTQYWMFVHL